MKDEEVLDMICEILKRGLEERGCKDVRVRWFSRGELEVDFIYKGEQLFYFYFG
jgi:hypothetical protein